MSGQAPLRQLSRVDPEKETRTELGPRWLAGAKEHGASWPKLETLARTGPRREVEWPLVRTSPSQGDVGPEKTCPECGGGQALCSLVFEQHTSLESSLHNERPPPKKHTSSPSIFFRKPKNLPVLCQATYQGLVLDGLSTSSRANCSQIDSRKVNVATSISSIQTETSDAVKCVKCSFENKLKERCRHFCHQ